MIVPIIFLVLIISVLTSIIKEFKGVGAAT
jgi:hypothetical protein